MSRDKIVMIPGPTPVVRSIQDQMGREVQAFGDPSFINDFKSVIEDLKSLFKTTGECFVVAGSGTLAMEMAIANSTKAGDNILIVSHGFFGDRFIDVCERKNLNVTLMQSEWGDIVPVEEIEKKLSEKNYAAITVTHVDTSTGVCAPIKEIGEMMKKFPDTIYIVDGVCSVAGEQVFVDEYGIDILFTGSQKAFGVSPGLMMLWAGKKSLQRRKDLKSIPEYYCDYEKWQPIMENPAKYFATPAINLVFAMKESIRIIKEEGLYNRYLRHKKISTAIRAALAELEIYPLAKEHCRAVTLSNFIYPDGINDAQFRDEMIKEDVIVAGGLAAYAGKMFRMGHMGNVSVHELVSTVAAVERALYKSGMPNITFGKALGAFQSNIV